MMHSFLNTHLLLMFQRALPQVPASTFKQTLDFGSLRTEWIKIQGEKLTQNQRETPCLKRMEKEQASLTGVEQALPHIYIVEKENVYLKKGVGRSCF